MVHAGAKHGPQLIGLFLPQSNLAGKGHQNGLGTVVVAAAGVRTQMLDLFHTIHSGILLVMLIFVCL